MAESVAKHDHAIKLALTRLVDLRENVWLEKIDKKLILRELDDVLRKITFNNDARNKEVEAMKWKLNDPRENRQDRR